MSRYVQNDEQMWGSYDFVDHGHEGRREQPALQGVLGTGDYDFGPGPLTYPPTTSSLTLPPRMDGFGSEPALFKLPDAGALKKPVVRGYLQVADPQAAAAVIPALTWTTLRLDDVAAMQQPTQTGALVPMLPSPTTLGKNWIRDAADAGKAVLYDVATVASLQPRMMVTSVPATVLQAAKVGGPYAVLAIHPALEQKAQALVVSPPADFTKLLVLGGAVVLIGGLFYAMTRAYKPYQPRREAML
jgi:hypothetical protein